MALSGHAGQRHPRPLLGVKQTHDVTKNGGTISKIALGIQWDARRLSYSKRRLLYRVKLERLVMATRWRYLNDAFAPNATLRAPDHRR